MQVDFPARPDTGELFARSQRPPVHAADPRLNFSGKANLPGFFKAVCENLELPVFEVKAIVASGSYVAVQLRIEGTVTKNGRSLANDAVHFWTFNEGGRISSYRHFNDTAAELAAWRS